MSDETVTVEALQYHTYNGQEYNIGDKYDIAADLVDSVTAQGKAVRVDRVAHAKAQADAGKKASKPVKPMGTKKTASAKKK